MVYEYNFDFSSIFCPTAPKICIFDLHFVRVCDFNAFYDKCIMALINPNIGVS